MRLAAKFAILTVLPGLLAAAPASYLIVGGDPGAWPQILASVGFLPAAGGPANLIVVRAGTTAAPAEWVSRVDKGAFIVLEGESDLATAFGFRPTSRRVAVQSVRDIRAPKLSMIWEKGLELPVFETPPDARVFTRERWQNAPLMAGLRRGAGAVLWLATTPGEHGYERFPYVLQALSDLGLKAPFRSERLWAFFDSAYRSRVDLDYFAERWRKAGIGALHVAAWHYYESDPQQDEYLRRLIEACHRHAILVYAWLELPHVSEKFWRDHPEWREKTALQQDAQLDWRKLINLTNRDAFHAVSAGVRSLIGRFDWDGVNLAELYFESLEGYANPARFTPMNADVRKDFEQKDGFDPLELFNTASPHSYTKDPAGLKAFLDYRAELARRQQAEWIGVVETTRRAKPNLDLVLTHVDDRFDTRMRDAIGADAARVVPLMAQHDFTFLIEDPATVWNLGPQRYPQIAARYEPLVEPVRGAQQKLAIDINIVERYQDVYPTKQQTGTELFQLVHLASGAFPRVALYFENSILKPDLPLLSSAAATVDKVQHIGNKLVVASRHSVGLPWKGPALVNGILWPVADGDTLWLPAGANTVEPAPQAPSERLLDFNGDLKTASSLPHGLEFSYHSNSRALARLERPAKTVEIDGIGQNVERAGDVLLLPRGQHLVTIVE